VAIPCIARGIGIRVAQFHDPLDDFLPGNSLDVHLKISFDAIRGGKRLGFRGGSGRSFVVRGVVGCRLRIVGT